MDVRPVCTDVSGGWNRGSVILGKWWANFLTPPCEKSGSLAFGLQSLKLLCEESMKGG